MRQDHPILKRAVGLPPARALVATMSAIPEADGREGGGGLGWRVVAGAALAVAAILWVTSGRREDLRTPVPAGPVQGALLNPPKAAPTVADVAAAPSSDAAADPSLVQLPTATEPSAPPMAAGKAPAMTREQAAAAASAAATSPAGEYDGDYLRTNFFNLAGYDYAAPKIPKQGDVPKEQLSLERFPAKVRSLHDKKVAVEGFMIPVEVERDKVRSFVLVSSPLVCCFGMVPKLNEWVFVRMEDGTKAPIMMDIPITVYGTLSIGEEIKDRTVSSLYRMQANRVQGPDSM